MTLEELAEHDSAASAVAAERTLQKIIPKLVRRGERWHVLLPGEPGFEEAR